MHFASVETHSQCFKTHWKCSSTHLQCVENALQRKNASTLFSLSLLFPNRVTIIQTARDWVRHWYTFDPSVIRSAKLYKTRVWESLFELAYSFTRIENLYFIVEVKHFSSTFCF